MKILFNLTFLHFSTLLCDLFRNMPQNKLTKQKMMTINEIVHSQLFLYPECRQILLPVFTKQIKTLLEQNEEVSFCAFESIQIFIRCFKAFCRFIRTCKFSTIKFYLAASAQQFLLYIHFTEYLCKGMVCFITICYLSTCLCFCVLIFFLLVKSVFR